MSWTDERTDTLKTLWADGLSASQIAKQLGGATRNAVIGKAHRLGLTGRANPAKPGERARRAETQRAPRAPFVPRATGQNNGLSFQSRKFKGTAAPPAVVPTPAEMLAARKRAWEPLPDSTPRPWTERGRGCAWPVTVAGAQVQHSCCRPKEANHPNYCAEHARLGVSEANAKAPRGSALLRSLRKVAT